MIIRRECCVHGIIEEASSRLTKEDLTPAIQSRWTKCCVGNCKGSVRVYNRLITHWELLEDEDFE